MRLPPSWFVYGVFLGSVGLWFSTTCRTKVRSTLLTLLAALLIVMGTWRIECSGPEQGDC